VNGEPLLDVRGLEVAYGPVRAVQGIDLRVHPGETVALLGANGAGKTSTLRTIAGLRRPSAGTIRFAGSDIRGRRPHRLARRTRDAEDAEGRSADGDAEVHQPRVV